MIGPPPGVRVWLAAGPTDMRRGFDGLSRLVQEALGRNPFSGRVFAFRGRRGRRPPELNHERGDPILVALAPGGTGRQDAASEAFLGAASGFGSGVPPGRRTSAPLWLKRQRVPLAVNVHVTVRREDIAERNR